MLLACYFQNTVVFSQQITQQNAPNKDIKLGMSNAFSGPVRNIGVELRQGSLVYFKRVNENNGIHGRMVKLISLDDGYEPRRTVSNTRKLIKVEQVLALFNYGGTPTSYAVLPMIIKNKIPYIMPYSGADFLRNPVMPNVFTLRASFIQEAQKQIDYLIKELSFRNIALVVQTDEFGLNAQRAIIRLLNKYSIDPIITTRFKRNTHDIENVLMKLKEKPVEAVIFIGTYKPFTHLINLAHKQKFRPVFTSFAISGESVLTRLKHPSRVIMSQVVPEPEECNWRLCQQFIIDMKKTGIKKTTRIQLEGYLNAFVFSQVAKKCPATLTIRCLQQKLETFSFKDNDLDINFSADNHQGLRKVYLSFSDTEKNYQSNPPLLNQPSYF